MHDSLIGLRSECPRVPVLSARELRVNESVPIEFDRRFPSAVNGGDPRGPIKLHPSMSPVSIFMGIVAPHPLPARTAIVEARVEQIAAPSERLLDRHLDAVGHRCRCDDAGARDMVPEEPEANNRTDAK